MTDPELSRSTGDSGRGGGGGRADSMPGRLADLVIVGGRVVDPASGYDGPGEVAIRDGLCVALGPSVGPAKETLDVAGRLVVPGLIDLHTHVFHGYHGADPDVVCLPRGTTTAFDGGSSGARAIAMFDESIAATRRTRVGAWLNISTIGLIEIKVGELQQLLYVNTDMAVEAALARPGLVVGFKIRSSEYVTGADFRPALRLARAAGEAAGLPLLVHIGDSNQPLAAALELLRPGDVVTHAYSGRQHGILGGDGAILDEVRAARAAGIRFDGAHGRRHFSFATARRALDQGFQLDTLSSDISYRAVTNPGFHLPLVMSKLMACGAPLEEVLPLVTAAPARFLGRLGEIGTLQPGASGDVAVLDVVDHPLELIDSDGQGLVAQRVLRPWRTVRAGVIHEAPAGV